MDRRKFLTGLPLIAATFSSCNFLTKKIPVDEDFFVKAVCINNVGLPLYKHTLKGETVYLTSRSLKIERGKKIKGLTGLEIGTTNKTYEGNDIYNIERLILSK
jgi:hypothetical protein